VTPAELTLTAALGAAFLTALGSLGVVWLQESRNRVRWQVTSEHDRVRVLNERFTAAAAQLGDHNAAVRLAGVHAMAGPADDWPEKPTDLRHWARIGQLDQPELYVRKMTVNEFASMRRRLWRLVPSGSGSE
jgi:hypothetical protein